MIIKKFILSIILILAALTGIQVNAQDIKFNGSAPPVVVVGQQFHLVYSFSSNTVDGKDLRLPAELSDNFNILYGPSITEHNRSTQSINNQRVSSVSSTYTTVLSAKSEGTFELSPATIKVGNAEYKSTNAVTIKVLPPDQAAQVQQQQSGGSQQQQGGNAASTNALSSENLFMQMTVSDRSVYEQEGILVTFKIYSAVDMTDITDAKFPEFEGFLAQDIEMKNIQRQLENYKGRNYNTFVVKQTVLFPQRSGKLEINGGMVKVVVRVPNQSRGRSFFDDFFDSSQPVSVELKAPPVTIDVKPLPTGKPASFQAAVGSYTMTPEINRTELKANEAVTIKLTIKGNGNIKLVKEPAVTFPNDFEVYDPVINNNIRVSTAGASGTKTIEYMAIPRFAGDFEIPPINFSYFDTKAGAYKTISSPTYNLHVEKGEGGSDAPIISNYSNRENVQFIGKDIRYIKTNDVHFISNKEIFFGSFLYVMAYLMITILFIVFFIIYRKQVRENSNIALVRTKKANKTAVKRLKKAESLLKDNKEEAFYEEVLRALWGYLSDKLNMPQSELTRENVAAELMKYGVDEGLTTEFIEIINTCEFARYAPNKSTGAMDKLFSETIDAIGKMENTIKK